MEAERRRVSTGVVRRPAACGVVGRAPVCATPLWRAEQRLGGCNARPAPQSPRTSRSATLVPRRAHGAGTTRLSGRRRDSGPFARVRRQAQARAPHRSAACAVASAHTSAVRRWPQPRLCAHGAWPTPPRVAVRTTGGLSRSHGGPAHASPAAHTRHARQYRSRPTCALGTPRRRTHAAAAMAAQILRR